MQVQCCQRLAVMESEVGDIEVAILGRLREAIGGCRGHVGDCQRGAKRQPKPQNHFQPQRSSRRIFHERASISSVSASRCGVE